MLNKLIFGTASLTSLSDYKKIIYLLEFAYDIGIKSFDTAPLYGRGYSEIILGDFLKNKNDINISTKFGLGDELNPKKILVKPLLKLNKIKNLIKRSNVLDNNINYCKIRRISKSSIKKNLNKSLKNLGKDNIENYLLHEALPSFLTDDAKDYLLTLKKNKIVKKLGIATSYNELKNISKNELDFFDIIQYDANDKKILNMKSKFPNHSHIIHSVIKQIENKSKIPDIIYHTIKSNNVKLIFSTRSINNLVSNISKFE
tara:strand:- start:22004 stop:22777 length:774 start_codon:yes stop_codon:yes gene_type:complete